VPQIGTLARTLHVRQAKYKSSSTCLLNNNGVIYVLTWHEYSDIVTVLWSALCAEVGGAFGGRHMANRKFSMTCAVHLYDWCRTDELHGASLLLNSSDDRVLEIQLPQE
jgi:hypothetical protein